MMHMPGVKVSAFLRSPDSQEHHAHALQAICVRLTTIDGPMIMNIYRPGSERPSSLLFDELMLLETLHGGLLVSRCCRRQFQPTSTRRGRFGPDMAVGHFLYSVTQPNPTHDFTDPTQPTTNVVTRDPTQHRTATSNRLHKSETYSK